MNILLKSYKLLTITFFISSFVWSENVFSQEWQYSFHRYSSPQKIIAPYGFILKRDPSLNARTIKETSSYVTIDVVGYLENLDTDRVRFYMSKWSWKRASRGYNANWVLIKAGGIGGKKWQAKWRENFVELPNIQQVYAETHMVKRVPNLYAKDVKIITISEYVNVSGYINTEHGRFYMSDWSWRRLSEGKDPYWVYINDSNAKNSSSEYSSNTYSSNTYSPSYSSDYSSSSYSSSDIYTSKRQRIFRRSMSALAQYATGAYIDNPVAAAAVGEATSSLIEKRSFSLEETMSSAVVNAFSKELRKNGHGGLAAALDIGNALYYIFSE